MRHFHRWLFVVAALILVIQTFRAFTSDDPLGAVLGAIAMVCVMVSSAWQERRENR